MVREPNLPSIKVEHDNWVDELPEDTVRSLASIAVRSGFSVDVSGYASAINQSIINEAFLSGLEAKDGKLVIKRPNEPMRYLLRT